jgi:sortase A
MTHAYFNILKYSFTISRLSIATLLLIVIWQWSQAGLITGKDHLAKWLIAPAWQHTLTTGAYKKPWPWADTWPAAKITFENKKSFTS